MLERVWLIPRSLSTLLLPSVASSSDKSGKNLTTRVCRNTFFILLIGMILLIILSKPLMSILYGTDYLPALLPMRILGLGIVFMGISRILFAYFNGKGRAQVNVYVPLFSMILNFVLNIIFIPHYGIAGAAFASLISYVVMALVLLFLFIRDAKVGLSDVLVVNREDLRGYKTLTRAILSWK